MCKHHVHRVLYFIYVYINCWYWMIVTVSIIILVYNKQWKLQMVLQLSGYCHKHLATLYFYPSTYLVYEMFWKDIFGINQTMFGLTNCYILNSTVLFLLCNVQTQMCNFLGENQPSFSLHNNYCNGLCFIINSIP